MADGTGAKSAVGTQCYTAPTAPATVATSDYILIDSKSLQNSMHSFSF